MYDKILLELNSGEKGDLLSDKHPHLFFFMLRKQRFYATQSQARALFLIRVRLMDEDHYAVR